MKKILLTLSLLVAFVWATPASAIGFDWGLTGGVNMTKVNFSKDMFDTGNRLGWFVGPKVQLSLPLGFGFDGAALYSQRRLNLSEDVNATETFRSLEIPINLRYSIGLGSAASVYFATGPQFGFNLGSKKWQMEGYNAAFKTETWNTSWNVGAGVKVLGHLEVGVSYNIALSKYAECAAGDDYDFKTNNFQAHLCYYF
ncbi:MAG: porin family protein [Bacteroidaceae bacterium]|nr:porin family protein [Bacteroidaceae bacterium]MBR2862153.1 porin family protein [Bacteroidaceae bacterium]